MKQLQLPHVPHPAFTSSNAIAAIRDEIKRHLLKDSGSVEVLGDPIWDWIEGEWRAAVAVRPWGPLLVMGFKVTSARDESNVKS